MTTVEAIKKIKELFMSEVPAPAAPVVPVEAAAPVATDYTLADGTVVSIDKLEVGGMVMIGGAPAPDGMITLADGTELETVAGLITEIETAEPLQASVETPAPAPAPLPNGFAAAQKDDTNAIALLKAENEKQREVLTQLFAVVEKMAAQEIAKPLEVKAKTWEQMSSLEQFKEQRKANIVC